ncbi:non-homologous end-joining DNA ligase [Sanguibacter sp. HDW7]|uniref:non-homologous end-joining DNA ligase n=1 Tax=Sanguibacter sp. HDW7 TaxID=2714931 RepID=UPI00351B7E03
MAGTQTKVGRPALRLTNLDKVLYPVMGTTKRDVVDYLVAVAPVLLPHAVDRPVTLKRWVHGVGTADEPGEVFFQKNFPDGTPEWVPTHDLVHRSRTTTYPVLDAADGPAMLAWFGQLAALELHVPQWRVALDEGEGRDVVHHPDRLVLDLDPGPGAGLPECVVVARACREIVEGMGLTILPVTSGSKGIHLYAGLDGTASSDQVSQIAHELARTLEQEMPKLVVSTQSTAERAGKVLLDWSQNSGAKTTVTPYSLRGRARPTVAAPRAWDELDDDLAHLTPADVLRRVEEMGDLLAPLAPRAAARSSRSRGGEGGTSRAEGADDDSPADVEPPSGTSDRLATYRAKRDPARTPEPYPDASADPTATADARPTFVIQDHRARRHHHDFRLEHDGVLLSWALPRLTPADPARNHLAVRTEDHPLDYGSFEGTIPRGEYGAGQVRIWDAGTYVAEKLRDDEVIVELSGRSGGGLATDGGRSRPSSRSSALTATRGSLTASTPPVAVAVPAAGPPPRPARLPPRPTQPRPAPHPPTPAPVRRSPTCAPCSRARRRRPSSAASRTRSCPAARGPSR